MLFNAYEAALTKAGFLAMSGQIIDASIVACPKQRNTEGEKAEIKAGRIPDAWKALSGISCAGGRLNIVRPWPL